MTVDQTKVTRKAKPLTIVEELNLFLQLCNFNRAWTDSYTTVDQPLNDMLKGKKDSNEKVQLNCHLMGSLRKTQTCPVPRACTMYFKHQQAFVLYVHDHDCYISGYMMVLDGKWCDVMTMTLGYGNKENSL